MSPTAAARCRLTGVFPGLQRTLDLTNTGLLTLLTGYRTPAVIRRIGSKGLETWLRNRHVARHVVRPDRPAEIAVQAAERQHVSLPGEQLAAGLGKAVEARFCDH